MPRLKLGCYVIVRRDGSPDNFKWVREPQEYLTYEQAKEVRGEALEFSGTKFYVYKKSELDAIGVPDTWEYVKGQEIK